MKKLMIFCLPLFLCIVFHAFSFDRVKLNINPGWQFYSGTPVGTPYQATYDDSSWKYVSLPHSFDVYKTDLSNYTRSLGWYRKTITLSSEYLAKRIFLEFQGAMEITTLYVNGNLVGQYKCSGYDSFHFDITGYAIAGTNTIAVLVDNNYNADCPPEGGLDYVLFGGLYRDVYLVVTDNLYINFPWEARDAGVRITTPVVSTSAATITVETVVRNASASSKTCTLVTDIKDKNGNILQTLTSSSTIPAGGTYKFTQSSSAISSPILWSPSNPYLYSAVSTVKEGSVTMDNLTTRFGIRWYSFSATTGFSLNGQPLKLVGANRHQTWPYVGNAVPNAIHRRDAEMIKGIGCNWVRCSHYPHDPDFLDALDELGLFALEEGPTWMGSGNAAWLTNLEKSFRSMIRRDRNHPSIIVWNSCINHEGCNATLSAAATNEDPTRTRGTCDIPCPMDFSHPYVSGNGALTIEHTGHTYPSGRGDTATELEHAKRHWEMTNAAYNTPSNSGLAVWCMFDYNTTRNTDEAGIAHHGVMDIYRLPKLSYYWHPSELTTTPMAYVYVSPGNTTATVFSNCDQVRLYQNDTLVGTQSPDTGSGKEYLKKRAVYLYHFKFSDSGKSRGFEQRECRGNLYLEKTGAAAALKVTADRTSIVADNSDFTRIIVSVVDSNGTLVPTAVNSITFSLSGPGELIGDNPVSLKAGMMIILAKSTLTTGTMTITATASGLTQGGASVTTTTLPSNYYVPDPVTTPAPTLEPSPDQTPGPTPVAGANLALNKSTTCSSSESNNIASYGNDGSTSTRWCASSGTFPQWWRADLGALYNLNESAIMWEYSGRTYGYIIEGSADDTNWATIINNTGNTATDQIKRDYFSVSNIRYLRLSVTSASSSGWASFFEFEVYGSSSSDTPAPTPAPTDPAATVVPTMAPNDSTPDQFTFTDTSGATLSTLSESQPISVTGINVSTTITVSNGEYKINSGSWISSAGTVISGDAVYARVTSSSNYSATVSAVITIGGVSDTFSVTTMAAPGTPDPTDNNTLAPTDAPTETPSPTETPAPTGVPTATPAGDTPAPTIPPADTSAPAIPQADTAAPTSYATESPSTPPAGTTVPESGCACAVGCSARTTITVPYTNDGAGELCLEAISIGSYVNSWNADAVNVNGIVCTNTYTSSSSISAISGVYYIYYKGSYSWSHMEIK